MPLPASAPRKPVPNHMRDVKYRGYVRDDGMWDIEAEMIDQKTFDIELEGERRVPAGKPIHHMWIRLTVDADLVVHDVEAVMDDHPLGHCPEATHPMKKMVGCCIAKGWRRAIQDNLGGVVGCTHLRELLFNMATPAFHSVLSPFRKNNSGQPPRHLGQCLGWDFNGPGVANYYPEFKGWQPLQRLDVTPAKEDIK